VPRCFFIKIPFYLKAHPCKNIGLNLGSRSRRQNSEAGLGGRTRRQDSEAGLGGRSRSQVSEALSSSRTVKHVLTSNVPADAHFCIFSDSLAKAKGIRISAPVLGIVSAMRCVRQLQLARIIRTSLASHGPNDRIVNLRAHTCDKCVCVQRCFCISKSSWPPCFGPIEMPRGPIPPFMYTMNPFFKLSLNLDLRNARVFATLILWKEFSNSGNHLFV
jgi:hypothetical protein